MEQGKKKYLLPEKGNFYKANLHCHSTVSDGALTPSEIKELYMRLGYSIVAYTDHDILVPHPELNDESFLALNGYELGAIGEECKVRTTGKACHIGMIALESDNLRQVCWHREKYLKKNAMSYKEQAQFYENEPNYERIYTPECVSDMMKKGREHGFFVVYNHPTWSMEDYRNYSNYHYMHAMEIFNNTCYIQGYDEYNSRVYDDMLRAGKRIFCIAADDNHNHQNDSGGGFVVIKADRLEYRTITRALEAGNFYSSQGPEIYELWYEDGKVHIKCSPAERIVFNFGNRAANSFQDENGGLIEEAAAEINDLNIYVRITVTDKYGKHANTNAYFISDLKG